MLRPEKHLDLDRSVLRISSEILKLLKKRRIVEYEAIYKLVKRVSDDDADIVVTPALSFLFLLGKTTYHPKTDSFEYLDLKEAQNAA